MLRYYLRLSWQSIRRHPILNGLTILAIALGIGVSMTTITVYYLMSSDPIPNKSDRLFAVQVDSFGINQPFDRDQPERAPHQMTYRDASELWRQDKADRQVAMFESTLIVEPEEDKPYMAMLRVTTGDFFPMFEVPFLYGGGWDKTQDEQLAQVVVLSKASNDKLFAGENSVGKDFRLGGQRFTVIGVMDTWNPTPRYYDVINGGFQEVADMMIPFSLTETFELRSAGSDWGWKAEEINSFKDWLNSESVWIQFWAELADEDAKSDYMGFLNAYVEGQKKLGRFERPLNNHLRDVNEWMEYNNVVRRDNKVLVGLSMMFLAVCVLSSVALILTRFLGKSPEIALRRALGANQTAVFQQHLMEVSIIGVIGGLLGILLATAGLQAVKALYAGQGFDHLVQLDWVLVSFAVGLALVSGLLAGLYPSWKVCHIPPASLLKSQ